VKLFGRTTFVGSPEDSSALEHSSQWSAFFDLVTLVHWPMVLIVGLIGFAAVPEFTKEGVAIVIESPSPPVEFINIELTEQPVSENTLRNEDSFEGAPPPPIEVSLPLQTAPSLINVADASLVAFALPVEGLHVLTEVTEAAYAIPTDEALGTWEPTETIRLTFGHGEGRQPAPRYPYKAQQQRQEGRIGITFKVGTNGRVISGDVTNPCEWRLLNNEALKTILERWRFSKGTARTYEVFLDFNLYD